MTTKRKTNRRASAFGKYGPCSYTAYANDKAARESERKEKVWERAAKQDPNPDRLGFYLEDKRGYFWFGPRKGWAHPESPMAAYGGRGPHSFGTRKGAERRARTLRARGIRVTENV